jgi:hypothetical protein
MATAFPTPEDDDAEDVAWGLTTGAALWRQGERYDAIVWLKRAVEAANEAGAATRADQLNRAATDLIAALATPPQSASPSAPNMPAAPRAPAGKPAPPRAPSPSPMPKAVPVPPKPPPPAKARTPLPFAAAKPAPQDAPIESSAERAEPIASPIAEPVAPPVFAPSPDDEPTPIRAPMPSVTTSAPPLEALTHHEPAPAEERRDPPPPPTIVPDVAPAPRRESAPPSIARRSSAPPPTLASVLDALPFTPDQKRILAETATIESLAAEEDVSVSCLALVVDGEAAVQATVADVAAVTLKRSELLYARSSIPETLSLRLVAEADPTTIALWDGRADDVLGETPDLLDRLKRTSDRIQAIAGCTMGPVGEQLDETLRAVAIERLEVRVLSPNEVIAPAGQPVPGMVIVGVGTVELEGTNGESDRLGPGDFLFASQVLAGGPAPMTARAGARGAIVLFGGRAVAHELLVTCPPLLEVFAGM